MPRASFPNNRSNGERQVQVQAQAQVLMLVLVLVLVQAQALALALALVPMPVLAPLRATAQLALVGQVARTTWWSGKARHAQTPALASDGSACCQM